MTTLFTNGNLVDVIGQTVLTGRQTSWWKTA